MGYNMKGSPFLKDVKMYEGSGSQITVDDASLCKVYLDEDGNKARDYTYTTKDGKKGTDILYLNKPSCIFPIEISVATKYLFFLDELKSIKGS